MTFPIGNLFNEPSRFGRYYSRSGTPVDGSMRYTPRQIGQLIKNARKRLCVTQKDLALTSGTGLRFIIELESGKPTCQIGKALTVLHTLGISMELSLPPVEVASERPAQ